MTLRVTPSRIESPAHLVDRIRSGEPHAETELVERYSRTVLSLLGRMTQGRALAEDLHQDTFCLVLEKVRSGELREPCKLPGFIQHLARNLFLADCRKRTRRSRYEDHGDPARGEAQVDPGPSPLTRLLKQEEAQRVRRLLSRLTPIRDRELLFRFFLAEETREEICADLGLNRLQFNNVLHRARRRFRKLIAKATEEPSTRSCAAGTVPRTAIPPAVSPQAAGCRAMDQTRH